MRETNTLLECDEFLMQWAVLTSVENLPALVDRVDLNRVLDELLSVHACFVPFVISESIKYISNYQTQ